MSTPMIGIWERRGSWLAVVVISSFLVFGLTPWMWRSKWWARKLADADRRTSQPHPEPWMAAVAALNSFFKLSRLPKDSTMACLRAQSFKTPPCPFFLSAAGARFFQKREWLIWPDRLRSKTREVVKTNEITSAVELEGSLQSNTLLGRGSDCIGLLRCIQSVDIGLMMLSVVKNHNLLRDVWFKSLVLVWKLRKCVSHWGIR